MSPESRNPALARFPLDWTMLVLTLGTALLGRLGA